MPDHAMTTDLDTLARDHGIAPYRPTPEGKVVRVSSDTKRKLLRALDVAVPESSDAEMAVCFVPPFLEAGKVWGISLEPYELRSSRNWGIGDFEDLAQLCELAGSAGADFVGLTPLHAPFLADPNRCSPYEPSSKQWLNPLYIAVDLLPGVALTQSEEAEIDRLRSTELVDYVGVAKLKLSVLRRVWRERQKTGGILIAEDQAAFSAFCDERGGDLRRHALFEVISAEMVERGLGAGWRSWLDELRDPAAEAVQHFAQSRLDEIEFHMWLQFLAHRQLQEVGERARQSGMRIGLYLDLAVGEALDGSATWSRRDVYVRDASIGIPPEPWALEGQDWRLAAFLPAKIADGKDAPYRRIVDAAMRYAGAIRIDHAAALRRLFIVPSDGTPAEGAYVDYPQGAMFDVLAEASHAHECLVIGEDLGLLPEGLQGDLAAAQILSYKILSYERDATGFKPVEDYPALALACISTQDHQTIGGWWLGQDVEMRRKHGLIDDATADAQLAERVKERDYLAKAFEVEGLTVPTEAEELSDEDVEKLTLNAYRFVARTPSMLLAIRLADLTREKEPTNVPGTSESYPNWKPKLSVTLEELSDLPLFKMIVAAMREERPR